MLSFPIIYYCYKWKLIIIIPKQKENVRKSEERFKKKCSQNQSIECDVWLCVFVGIGNGGGVWEWGRHEILCIDLH